MRIPLTRDTRFISGCLRSRVKESRPKNITSMRFCCNYGANLSPAQLLRDAGSPRHSNRGRSAELACGSDAILPVEGFLRFRDFPEAAEERRRVGRPHAVREVIT